MIKYFKYIKYTLLLFLIIILLIHVMVSKKELTNNDVNNLMIVAHKEDGLIWGGNNLVNDRYLVVCITCSEEDQDFIKIMKNAKNKYVLLNYDEETDFYEERNILERDLNKYLYLKDWDKIVTHNPDGEYGSDQHKTINSYVNKLLDNKEKLYYFNKYYLKEELVENSYSLYLLSREEVDRKVKMLGMLNDIEYVKEFEHIIPYEEFIIYKEWGNNNE